jgi:periplasmic protein CpxP/Spy
MKRFILPGLLAMTLSGGLAFGQAPAAPADSAPAPSLHEHADPHRQAMRMSKKLNLSADQMKKLEPILADRDQKIAALRSNSSLSKEDMKAQRRAIHKDTMQQLSSVLTPEQMQQLKAMHHGHGEHDGGAPAPSGV